MSMGAHHTHAYGTRILENIFSLLRTLLLFFRALAWYLVVLLIRQGGRHVATKPGFVILHLPDAICAFLWYSIECSLNQLFLRRKPNASVFTLLSKLSRQKCQDMTHRTSSTHPHITYPTLAASQPQDAPANQLTFGSTSCFPRTDLPNTSRTRRRSQCFP